MGVLGFTLSYIAFSVVHIIQFALGITIIGLYGTDLAHAKQAGVYSDPKWGYAVFVGAISAFTALVYLIPFVVRFWLVWAWNIVLFILSIALFGLFANKYLHEDPEGDSGIQRMKNAIWVDLTSALLWLLLAVGAFGYWWGHRERQTRFTGRARV